MVLGFVFNLVFLVIVIWFVFLLFKLINIKSKIKNIIKIIIIMSVSWFFRLCLVSYEFIFFILFFYFVIYKLMW